MKQPTLSRLLTFVALFAATVGTLRASYLGTLTSATAPAEIIAGDSINISVTVRNTGSTAWQTSPTWLVRAADFSWDPTYNYYTTQWQWRTVNSGAYDTTTVTLPVRLFNPGTYYVNIYAYHNIGPGFPTSLYPLMIAAPKIVAFKIVDGFPAITRHPQSITTNAGYTVRFDVAARGSYPLQYQWRRDGTNIPGATSSYLYLFSANSDDAGNYSVVVKNNSGSVTSSNAVLKVNCHYSLGASSERFNYDGGQGSFYFYSSCRWTFTTPNPWISILSNTNGTGYGTVFYTVATNLSQLPRTGKIVIGDQTFSISQGPVYAPLHLRGKNLILTIGSSGGALSAWGKYLVTTRSGTNNLLHIVPLSGSSTFTNSAYTFRRINARSVSFAWNGKTTTLNFDSPEYGSFSVSSNASWQRGSFTMTRSNPDLNGDGRTDILWQNPSTRILTAWLMGGTNPLDIVRLNSGLAAPTGWRPVACADFNADGNDDILFHTANTGLSVWLMNRTRVLGVVPLRAGTVTGTNQTVVSVADFNNDSHPDVLLQNNSGALTLWNFSRTNYLNTVNIKGGQPANPGWKAVATADFNHDRQVDILFQHTSGAIAAWLMQGVNYAGSMAFTHTSELTPTWRVMGAGDFDLNGYPDILWRNNAGQLHGWNMRYGYYAGTFHLPPLPNSAGLNCVSPK